MIEKKEISCATWVPGAQQPVNCFTEKESATGLLL